jgi:hypothetical protein
VWEIPDPFIECLAFISILTAKSFFQNCQLNPHGIDGSAQFVNPALRIVQPEVLNRVLYLNAILE